MPRNYRQGAKMGAALDKVLAEHGVTLKEYLRDQANRNVSDRTLADYFKVSRHTISNWRRLLGIEIITRAELVKR